MGLYEGIKDVAKVVQQADNIELYRQLVDLSAQALEMQNKIEFLLKVAFVILKNATKKS